ncbi:DUF6206 family protein [Roseibacterium sp. SDUM158016]|jgi:hypothetical protein|uniref:DUF6206 family protein n=1 Tax=Roseicyclus sediminis TaxID=2980997 RepID=UPI0021CE8899|nr:DUF6206 family protein [Roseibacterium sp. SDUM158016]MCU4655037.1 DUF6206 family protein [Roseibacterium sp. SDUM158016]
MSELAGQVRAALADARAGEPDRMGYFSAPFRPSSGPLSTKVLKPYRTGRDPELLEQLVRRHESYLDCLDRAGLPVPPTRLLLLDEHGFLRPVVVQDAVPREALLSALISGRGLGAALQLLEGAADSVCSFWAGVAQRPERIGLHASVHNFAIDATAGAVYLDTFPPLIGYSRDDMGRLLVRFSESGLIRGIGSLLPGRVREIQDPWYTLPGNLGLLIEGAMRLRPQDREAMLGWAEAYAAGRLDASDRSALLTVLSRPRPRIGGVGRARGFGFGLRPNA